MDRIRDLLRDIPGKERIDDKEVEKMMKMYDAVSSLTNQSMYVVDYLRQEFLYISPHPLFLCGYTLEEAQAMGYSFLEKVFTVEDWSFFVSLFEDSFHFICEVAPEKREHIRMSYDIHLQHKNGDIVLVNCKVMLLFLSDEVYPWLGVAIITPSAHKERGNFVIKNKDQYFRYDIDTRKFVEYAPGKLSRREEEVLRLTMQGYDENGIAEKMNISVVTVRNHRNNARTKLGVSNLANAVGMLYFDF